MKVNEKEIFDVSDTSSLTIKQKKSSKESLQALLNNVFFYNDYHSVHTYKRSTRFNISSYVNVNTSIKLYTLFIIRAHRKLLINYINLKADIKLRKMLKKEPMILT